MRKEKVDCLPVVKQDRLVGVVTERDFINVAARLLEINRKAEGIASQFGEGVMAVTA